MLVEYRTDYGAKKWPCRSSFCRVINDVYRLCSNFYSKGAKASVINIKVMIGKRGS